MYGPIKPIYLFADSQLLFWKNDGRLFIESVKSHIEPENVKAAYIGASNDDTPEYYSIFEAAMNGIGISDCRMIQSKFSPVDNLFLKDADLILLAGGDVKKGWDTFVKSGMKDLIIKKYYSGAVLIGLSAGAVQLCLGGWSNDEIYVDNIIYTFKLGPFLLGVHEEKEDWSRLKRSVRVIGNSMKGIGISSGGGLIYHPDHSLEAIRFPVHEFSIKNKKFVYCLLYPPSEKEKECVEEPIQL